jgi:hypothetical protein
VGRADGAFEIGEARKCRSGRSGDADAAARTSVEEAVGDEIVVGGDDRIPRDAEELRHDARGGKASAGRKAAGADGEGDLGVNLAWESGDVRTIQSDVGNEKAARHG